MNRLAERKYLALLVSLIILVVVYPILRMATETRLLLDVLFSLVFLAALLVIFEGGRLRIVAILLGVPTLVGLSTNYLIPGIPRLPLEVWFHVLAAMFLGFTTGIILRSIHGEKSVSSESVYGAFCGYLLLGLAFAHVFCLLELLEPNSFQGAGFSNQLSDDRRHFLLVYFSFLTLTTVGYGDITPNSDAARSLAATEAIMGQFYLAVLIAELIGKRVSQAATLADAALPSKSSTFTKE